MSRMLKQGVLIILGLLLTGMSFAHTGFEHSRELYYGLLHPVTGLDHLLALFAVGLLASRYCLRSRLAMSAVLLVMMAIGATAGMLGSALAVIEFGITGSLLLLGGIITIGKRLPVAIALIAVSLIGMLHGYAHGQEIPLSFNAVLYFTGFLISSLGIQLLGLLIGRTQQHGEKLCRFTGGLVSLSGIAFLVNNL